VSLQRSPNSLSGFQKPASTGREGKGIGDGREGEGWKGEGRKEGKKREFVIVFLAPVVGGRSTPLHLSDPV